ncbi:Putative beta-lactamase HcpC precursor [Polystyrenella longa]|uniref:Beta-lactamase HcpC n=1 Tax=Polystyrenella longa TaxID=2528007 RepID=A0A518CL51_9PLAN|nr:tetratricopeptide repeat protein [Polystyrenella longa]QDU79949.1 Putative beta-lactamase HcpC precursor [Polystyrenella longa]
MKSTELASLYDRVDVLLDRGQSAEAVVLLKRIASAGDVWGQYMLGLAYHYGDGVGKSRKQAEKWYSLAAEQNYDSALLNLGLLYASRRPPAYGEAYRLFQRAARLGNRNAMYNLGLYYERGHHVKANSRTSFRWYFKAAELGDDEAQCMVGYCYHEGEGISQNKEQAVHWYRLSANQDNASACYNLGLCYGDGDGVRRSVRQARRWLEQAIILGHVKAGNQLRELSASPSVSR